jgi:hypothetical protein
MLNKILKFSFVSAIITSPIFSFAQGGLPYSSGQPLSHTKDLLTEVSHVITGFIIPIVFALGLLFFFYGVVKYIWSAGGEKEAGKKIMIWGIVGLFVMASVWGLVRFVQGEFNITDNSNMEIPSFK